jgi:hypothetical protein
MTAPGSISPPDALVIACPPGKTPGQLLADIIDAVADAAQFRAQDQSCGSCTRTRPCPVHAYDAATAGIYTALYDHLASLAPASAA